MAGEERRQATARLRRADATILAHALGAKVAEELSVRVLSIKGPAADHHALRAPRVSADADLLVDPAEFRAFCEALERRGWHERVARSTPSILELHSRTYIHPEWPCDIDVHDRFPGFFAPSEMVFQELWERREALTVGNVTIVIPSIAASAVIAALHALRNMSHARHRSEWAEVVEALKFRFTRSQQLDFLRLAEVGKARWVLRDAIDEMGFGPSENDLDPNEDAIWTANLRFGPDGGAVGWIRAMKGGTLSDRALLLMRAVWVPRDFVPRNEEALRLSTTQVLRYQFDRWRRGARAVLKYLRAKAADASEPGSR